jgi:hypothetical protein
MSGHGPTGSQGVQGIQGMQGNQGIQGATGLQGPAGSGGGGGASLTSTSNIVITAPSGVGINTTPAYTLDLNGGSLGNVGTLNVSKASSGIPLVVNDATEGVDYTITTSGSKTFYTFKTVRASGVTQMSITNTRSLTVDYLALGGGGGGGSNWGAGGGAGGLRQASGYALSPGTRTITIGDGGAGNTSGQNTVFGVIETALGGGRGGYGNDSATYKGGNGGSGGGGRSYWTGAGGTGSQGFPGGAGGDSSQSRSGGGGGVGGAGQNGPSGGAGGVGIEYNNGTLLQLGGGGGGGSVSQASGTASFGGGVGGFSVDEQGGNGDQNTGGGGGGGGGEEKISGGAGGSGIFILAFNTADIAPGAPLTFASASIDASYNLLLSATSNIRLTASNVGINVTQPTVALDVAGQIRGRVVLSNWAGPTGAVDFTSSTGNSIYNYITNTGFNALTLGNPGAGYVGSYSVIKNNTTTGLSIALTYATGATGPTSPLILYSSNATTLIWSGPTGGYIQF